MPREVAIDAIGMRRARISATRRRNVATATTKVKATRASIGQSRERSTVMERPGVAARTPDRADRDGRVGGRQGPALERIVQWV